VQSRLIEDFTGKPSEVRRAGRSIYRWLVSMDDVLAEPDLRAQFDPDMPGFLGWRDPVKDILWGLFTFPLFPRWILLWGLISC